MEQSTILEYAKQHLIALMDKLENNLDNPTVSPFQRGVFERNLEKYKAEHSQICTLLRDSQKWQANHLYPQKQEKRRTF